MSSCKRSNAGGELGARAGLGMVALLGASMLLGGCPVDDRSLGTEGTSSGSTGNLAEAGRPPLDNEGGNDGEAEAGEGGDAGARQPPNNGGSSGSSGTAGVGGGVGGGSGGNGGSAGSATGGGGNGGVSAGGGGTSGGGGTDDYGAGGCGDLDQDLVQDCSQTLLGNSRFMTDVAGWTAEKNFTQRWDSRNARAGQASGAISVTSSEVSQSDGLTLGGSAQCLVAEGDKKYVFGARAFIPAGQGGGSAALNVMFFAKDDCADILITGKTTSAVTETNVWRAVEGTFVAPTATRSMLVRLVTVKPYKLPSFEALFDDVLGRAE